MLQRGFDPNSADPSGRPSLLTAVQAQSPNVVKALLAHPDLKVDALNTAGELALMLAAIKGDLVTSQHSGARCAHQPARLGADPLRGGRP